MAGWRDHVPDAVPDLTIAVNKAISRFDPVTGGGRVYERYGDSYTGIMRNLCVWVALLLSPVACSFAQTARIRVLDRTVIQQDNSPLEFVQWRGSSAVIKNVSDKRIESFVFVCLVREGKTYSKVGRYDSSEGSIDPGKFTHVGGFDATPLNACRSWKGLLAVASVKFADEGSWVSPFINSVQSSSSN